MKLKGPIVTLAAGAIFAAVLLVLNSNATRAALESATPPNDSSYGEETSAAAAPSTAAPTTPAPTAVAEAPVTYAGSVGGGGATLAIAVRTARPSPTSVTAAAPRPGCRAPGAAAHSP